MKYINPNQYLTLNFGSTREPATLGKHLIIWYKSNNNIEIKKKSMFNKCLKEILNKYIISNYNLAFNFGSTNVPTALSKYIIMSFQLIFY